MLKSESITNIAKALILFHVKVDKIKKDSKNPFFKSSYASLSTILNSIDEPLRDAGLAFCQFPVGENGLTTILIHAETGEYIQANYEMKPVKDDPQGRGSVITYQRRYALAAILGLNIEDDDDANTATHGGKTPETVEDMRPWMSESQFKMAMSRIEAGHEGVYQKANEAFRMKKEYRSQLKEFENAKS